MYTSSSVWLRIVRTDQALIVSGEEKILVSSWGDTQQCQGLSEGIWGRGRFWLVNQGADRFSESLGHLSFLVCIGPQRFSKDFKVNTEKRYEEWNVAESQTVDRCGFPTISRPRDSSWDDNVIWVCTSRYPDMFLKVALRDTRGFDHTVCETLTGCFGFVRSDPNLLAVPLWFIGFRVTSEK